MHKPFSLSEVRRLASDANVIPLVLEVLAGDESPVAIFEKLAVDNQGSFLLESAEHGVWSRYSFIGVNSRGFISKNRGRISWTSSDGYSPTPTGALTATTGLAALEEIRSAWHSPDLTNFPPLTSGLVGFMGWNMISEIESIDLKEAGTPDLLFALFSEAVIVDHETGTLLLVANIFVENGSELEELFRNANQKLEDIVTKLSSPHTPFLAKQEEGPIETGAPNMTRESFLEMVETAKEYVRIGDVFQVVLSQRFDYETSSDALSIYRVLRALNPSPYMYLINGFDDSPFAVVGSSPEALVKISNQHAITHPIAGSRPRGANWDADLKLEEALVADEKERAEHLMLVDLARNDLLKVCDPDSISVTEFMEVHKFSHIQHLVSTVEGDLREGVTPVDVFRATFPAGTLSGAPKPRALEIISDLEPDARGIYGGVVGYFDFAQNADLAIAIRTLVLRKGLATVQAGAGIVLDSNPTTEYEETVSKASAPGRAIARANNSRRFS